MGAFSGISQLFSGGIVAQARRMGYSAENIIVLQGNVVQLQANYPTTWENIQSCQHNRDNRSPLAYAQDLVASWLIEDYIIGALNDAGLPVAHAGADKERKILANAFVSSDSDASVVLNGKSVPLELMCDYKGYWSRFKKIDLRDSKFTKLKNSESLFLGISTTDKKFILLDFSKPVNSTFIPSHFPFGGKSAYSVAISANDLHNFSTADIVAAISNARK